MFEEVIKMEQDIAISNSPREKNPNIICNFKTQGLYIICT